MPEFPNLTEGQKQTCRYMFESFDKYGYGRVRMSDFIEIAKILKLKILCQEVKENLDIDYVFSKDSLKFEDFEIIFRAMKILQKQTSESILNTFMSFGGNPDQSGYIQKERLAKVMRQQFELPINAELLLQEADQNRDGEVDFQEFTFLLK